MSRKKNSNSSEFKRFETAVEALMQVPRAEIKAKLDAEKKEKAERIKGKIKRPD
jgi:hypothetical protein